MYIIFKGDHPKYPCLNVYTFSDGDWLELNGEIDKALVLYRADGTQHNVFSGLDYAEIQEIQDKIISAIKENSNFVEV